MNLASALLREQVSATLTERPRRPAPGAEHTVTVLWGRLEGCGATPLLQSCHLEDWGPDTVLSTPMCRCVLLTTALRHTWDCAHCTGPEVTALPRSHNQ